MGVTDPTTTHVGFPHAGRRHAERVVASPLGQLVEGEPLALAQRRPRGLDEQLVGRERGRVRAEEELLAADLAASRAEATIAVPPQSRSASGSSAAASAWRSTRRSFRGCA